MTILMSAYTAFFQRLERADWLLATLARFVFAAVLAVYFWNSGLTKIGDGIFGIFTPSTGAYAQIFPRVFEAVGYDSSQLSFFHWAVVVGGTIAEFVLPALIVLGLMTRLAALGMIGFVFMQSLTDIYGHGAMDHPETIGAWFDRFENSAIMDQRTLWVFVLMVLVIKGAGPLSLDRIVSRRIKSGL